jgi:hypothetical protein
MWGGGGRSKNLLLQVLGAYKEVKVMKIIKTALMVTVFLAISTGCATDPPIKNPQISKSNLPQAYFIENVPTYKQGYNECGPTSLQMVMSFYGKSLTKGEIVKSVFMKSWGTPISEMESYARRQKFGIYSFYGWREGKMKYLIAQGYPLIVLGEIPSNWYPDGSYAGIGHYVVVVGYDDTEKKFVINDPGLGRKMEVPYGVLKNFLLSTKFSESNYVLCIYPKGN